MKYSTESRLTAAWAMIGVASLIVILVSLFKPAQAGDWAATALVSSWHDSGGFTCRGVERDWNERNPGLLVRYKILLVGRYENSHADCAGVSYSNVFGLELPIGRVGPFDLTATTAVADGYLDENSNWGEYRPWASVNIRMGVFKVMYAYKVAAFGLHWEFK